MNSKPTLEKGLDFMSKDIKIFNSRVRGLKRYLDLRGDITGMDPREDYLRTRCDIAFKKLTGMRQMFNNLMDVYSRFNFENIEYYSEIVSIDVFSNDISDFTWNIKKEA